MSDYFVKVIKRSIEIIESYQNITGINVDEDLTTLAKSNIIFQAIKNATKYNTFYEAYNNFLKDMKIHIEVYKLEELE